MASLLVFRDNLGVPLDQDTQALQRGVEQWCLVDDPNHLAGALLPAAEIIPRSDGQPGFQVRLISLWTSFGPGLFGGPALAPTQALCSLVGPATLVQVPVLYLDSARRTAARQEKVLQGSRAGDCLAGCKSHSHTQRIGYDPNQRHLHPLYANGCPTISSCELDL